MRTWTRGLRGPRASQLAWGAFAAALVLGVVVTLAVPAAGLAALEERVARLEGIIEQIDARLRTLEGMVGLSMAWNTMLVGAAVGVLLKDSLETGVPMDDCSWKGPGPGKWSCLTPVVRLAPPTRRPHTCSPTN